MIYCIKKFLFTILIDIFSRTKKSEIESATCTDVRQKWGKLKKDAKALYDVVPIKKFCHGTPKHPIFKLPKISEEQKKKYFNMVIAACPNSELAKMKRQFRSEPLPAPQSSRISQEYCREILSSPIRPPLTDQTVLFAVRTGKETQSIALQDLPPEQLKFFNDQVRVTLDEAVKIATEPGGQGSTSWLKARSTRITASKARELVTYYHNRSPDWDSKISGYYSDKFHGTPETAHGNRAEPWARKCYEQRTGHKVIESGLMVNPHVPWLGCSHDGIVANLKTVEFKCPVSGKTKTASEVMEKLTYIDSPEPNVYKLKELHNYFCQVQLGLFVANLKQCDFVIYSTFDDTCVILTIDYNEELVFNHYLPKLQYIYFTHCLKHFVKNIDANK